MQIYAAKQHPDMEKYILTFIRDSGLVRVHRNETVHSGLRFGFRFGSTPCSK